MRTLTVLLLAITTPALPAQASRETAEATVGSAKVRIEYGAPPWSDERRTQVDRMPVGSAWRLGADGRTTLVVDGGEIWLGDALIESGGYGLNLRRTGEKEWAFVVFDGSDINPGPADAVWEAPATLVEKSDTPPEILLIAFDAAEGRQTLRVRFGPLEITAPVVAVETKEAELAFGSESATSRWFARKAPDAPKPGTWMRAGRVGSFYVGDLDCGMDVDWKLDGATARVRIANRERAKLADRLARTERELAQLSKAAAGGSRRAQGRIPELEKTKAGLVEEIAALVAPQPLELEVKLAPAKARSARFSAELVRRAGTLTVVVNADDRAGETAIDESRLLPESEQ